MKATWKGPERHLPGLGIARRGQPIDGPDETVQSYIDQGLAEAPAAAPTPARGAKPGNVTDAAPAADTEE